MGKEKMMGLLIVGVVTAVVTGCGIQTEKGLDEIQTGNQVTGVSVHDPAIVKAGEKYYVFGTHMSAAESEDLIHWKQFADGVKDSNPLFDDLLHEGEGAFSYVGKYQDGNFAVWAPDVMYNDKMGKWIMYFSVTHDYITSTICMATADQVEGPYTYQAQLVSSGFTVFTVDKTNFHEVCGEDTKVTRYMGAGHYNNLKYPNCIDPCVFYGDDGKLYMVYGSWSGGIYLLELDENTGLPIHPETNEETNTDKYFGQYLLGGLHNSCEGPYILYDAGSDYYYLFVSYGGLTREGGYQIRLFRSREVTGPYLDTEGNTLGYVTDHSGYGLKIMGNYDFPSLKTAYMAPGHNSAFRDDDGKYYVVYHQRLDSGSEYHEVRVHQMFLNEEGWFVTAPFATQGESLREEGYRTLKEFQGTYYVVNHGTDISSDIHEAEAWTISGRGEVNDAQGEAGKLELTEGTCFVTLTLGENIYKGVVVEMNDEAGNAVECLSFAGNNNESIWAVRYLP